VTRGLLAIMNSEAELAAVLGHELGHVSANHAARQKSQEAMSGIAAALVGAVAKSDAVGQIAGRVAQLGSLSYSRSQEYEADTLALRYLPAAGYSADGLARVLDDLQREDAFSRQAGGRAPGLPVWASTHPLTADRIQRADRQAAVAPEGALVRNQADYLAAIDGLSYGDAAFQGQGRTYVDRTRSVAFDAPGGFVLANLSDAVRIEGPGGLKAEFWGGEPLGGRLDDHAYAVIRGVVGQAPVQFGAPQAVTINGFEAVVLSVRGAAQGRPVDLVLAAYRVDDRAYQFLTVAPAGRSAAFDPLIGSFRRASRAAAATGGRHIALAIVRPGDTAESLATRMAPGGDRVGRFLMLNALQAGEPLRPGDSVKLVVEGPPGRM